MHVCTCIYSSIHAEKYSQLYAFHYKPKEGELVKQSSGWALFDSQNEYSRMGVPNELWRSTSLNYDYEVCTSHYNSVISLVMIILGFAVLYKGGVEGDANL